VAHLLRRTPFGCGMSKEDCNADIKLSKQAKKDAKQKKVAVNK